MIHAFTARGVPKPQPRGRAVKRGAHAGVYDPGTADGWKMIVRNCGSAARPSAPLSGPIRIRMDFVFARPQGHYRKRKGVVTTELKPDAPLHHTMNRFDPDNLSKAVMDAMTNDAWWVDDGYVVDLHVTKRWGSVATQGVRVEVEEMGGPFGEQFAEPTYAVA